MSGWILCRRRHATCSRWELLSWTRSDCAVLQTPNLPPRLPHRGQWGPRSSLLSPFQKQTCPGAQKQEVRILAVLFEEDTLGSAGKPANAGFHCWAPALGVWLANPCANTWGWYHQGNCQTSTSQRQAEWQTEGIWRIFFSFFSAYFCLRAPKLPTQAMKSAHTCFPAAPQASGGR